LINWLETWTPTPALSNILTRSFIRIENHGICSLQKKKKKNTYLAFLDLSKAFDRVWREGLFFFFFSYGKMVSNVTVGACYGPFIWKSTTVSFSVITNNFHTVSLPIRLPTTITLDLVSLNFKFHLSANFDECLIVY
jgi:hypothetical protein